MTTMMHQFHKKNGDESYRNEDYHNAIFHYTLAIETAQSELSVTSGDPLKHQLASLYSNRAAASTMMRHYQDALLDCDSAIASEKTYDRAYLRKAQLQVVSGMLKEAMATCDEVLRMDPHNTRAQEHKQHVEAILLKYQEANNFVQRLNGRRLKASQDEIIRVLSDIESILSHCIAWDDVKVLQAQALWALGHSDVAFDIANRLAQQQHVENAQLHNLLATIFIQRGKSEEAIIHLRTVLARDSTNEHAVMLFDGLRQFLDAKAVADRAYKSRRFDDALEQYDFTMKICPQESPTYMAKVLFNRACANASLGRHALAINDCSESIRLNDRYIKAYMRRAASHRRMNYDRERRGELAMSDYKVALSLCKTKAQSREIIKKLMATKAEVEELERTNEATLKKLQSQRRHSISAPMMVTPENSPDRWMHKSAPLLVRTKTEDSETSLSLHMSRSRTSSTSSLRSFTNSPTPLSSGPMDVA